MFIELRRSSLFYCCLSLKPAVQESALARGRFVFLTHKNHPTERAQVPAGHIFQLTDELTQVEFEKTLGLHNFISVEKENKKVGETCR